MGRKEGSVLIISLKCMSFMLYAPHQPCCSLSWLFSYFILNCSTFTDSGEKSSLVYSVLCHSAAIVHNYSQVHHNAFNNLPAKYGDKLRGRSLMRSAAVLNTKSCHLYRSLFFPFHSITSLGCIVFFYCIIYSLSLFHLQLSTQRLYIYLYSFPPILCNIISIIQ